ncbi:hypothetical protein ACIQYL_20305 [Lysinibacillus xylanilyticus]|uniref:hypothetical protein n=1 Tax=Lysinibacillus xylanilyticus TaxID=582475 RepID=UPI00382D2249
MYEIIGLNDDPLYILIDTLQENEEIVIETHIVRKIDKFFEVENNELHESFKSKIKCYRFIDGLLNFR